MAKENKIKMSDVKLFLTDVDGCLTDGSLYYSANGEEMKHFCVYDGMGMVLLQQLGIPCGILTSENSPIVHARAKKLNLQFLYLGVGSRVNANVRYFSPAGGEPIERSRLTKLQAAQRICSQLDIELSNVCYVGDDINDIDLLSVVGFPCCPPNARPEVKSIPGIRVLNTPGGQGAIREVTDLILDGRTTLPMDGVIES